MAGISAATAKATHAAEVRRWDYEAEIVALGIGAAGRMIPITAHEQGADVLILEKASEAHPGGNWRVSGQGYWGPSNLNNSIAYQKAMKMDIPFPMT